MLVAVALVAGAVTFALNQKGLIAVVGSRRVTQDDFTKLISYYIVNNPDGSFDDYVLNTLYYYVIVNAARMQLADEWGISVTWAEAEDWYKDTLPDLELYMLLDEADHAEVEYDYMEILFGEDPQAEISALEVALGTTGKTLFQNAMTSAGLTEREFKEIVHQNLTMSALDRAIEATLEVSESEALDLFERYRDSKYSDMRYLSHILVKTIDDNYEDLSDEEITAADELIHELLRRLQEEDADFAELAEEYSEDPGSAVQGGYLGGYTLDDMFGQYGFVIEFAVAAAELTQPGELSGVVETMFGYHILRLDDYREYEFEDVRDNIVSELVSEKALDKRRELLTAISVRPVSLKEALVENGW